MPRSVSSLFGASANPDIASKLSRMHPDLRMQCEEFKSFYLDEKFSKTVNKFITWGQFHNAEMSADKERKSLLLQIKEKQAALNDKAAEFYTAFTMSCNRMPVPEKGEDTDVGVITQLLAGRQGLFVDEANNSTDGLQLIYDNMAALKQQGVGQLFVGWLQSEAHQKLLDEAANHYIPQELEDYLKNLDKHFLSDKTSDTTQQNQPAPGFYQLVASAQQHGIKVIALGCTANFLAEKLGIVEEISDGKRLKINRYHCREIIQYFLLANNYNQRSKYVVHTVEHRSNNNLSSMNALELANIMKEVSLSVQKPGIVTHNYLSNEWGIPTTAHFVISRDGSGISAIEANPLNARLRSAATPIKISPPDSSQSSSLANQSRTLPLRADDRRDFMQFNVPQIFRKINAEYISKGILDIAKMESDDTINYLLNEIKAKQSALISTPEHAIKYTLPTLPELTSGITATALIDGILQKHRGMFICQGYNNNEGIKFILDNLTDLHKKQVKKIYLSIMIHEVHQRFLDIYRSEKPNEMPWQLANYLQYMDKQIQLAEHPANVLSAKTPYGYMTLVTAANKLGIEVIALNCAANSLINGINIDTLHRVSRQRAQHTYAKALIDYYQAAKPEDKFVALVNNPHRDIVNYDAPLTIPVYNLAREIHAVSIRVDKPGEIDRSVIEVKTANAFLFPDFAVSHIADSAHSSYTDCRLNITTGQVLAEKYYQR